MSATVEIPTFERVRNDRRGIVPGYTRSHPGQRMWTREKIIQAIQQWDEMTGVPPRMADWNPSMARQIKRRRNLDQRVGLYASGHWPSAATVQRMFGSWRNAIRAAGLKPHPTGPRRSQAAADVIDLASDGTPGAVLGQVKAVIDAHREKDYAALHAALGQLAGEALAWRERLETS